MKSMQTIEFAGTGKGFTLRGPHRAIRVENLRYTLAEEESVVPFLPTDSAGTFLVPHPGSSPLLPGILATLNPEARVEVFNLDRHETRLLAGKLAPFAGVCCRCGADLTVPDGGPGPLAAVVVFRPGDARDLLFDTLERLAMILPLGSGVLLALPKVRAQDVHRHVTQCLTITGTEHVRGQVIFRARTRANAKPWTAREATFAVTTAAAGIRLITRPGVFAHGRADAGALALAESAAVVPTDCILDIGAGPGTVGLLLAEGMRRTQAAPSGRVVLVDSNARAVACAERSLALNGFGFVTTALADQYVPEPPAGFDVVVANPPYFNDHGICRFFVAVAARALKPGGRLFLVSKHAQVVAEFAAAAGLTLLEQKRRRGYDITVARR